MTAAIKIKGAYATLKGAPVSVLEKTLTVLDPKRYHNRAFREHRWDGKIRLFNGRKFPAGLVQYVVDYLNSKDQDVTVIAKEEKEPIDTSRFHPDYLGGIGPDNAELIDEQCGAILTMFNNARGIVKSPTGSGKTEMIAVVAQYLWEERGWRSLIVTSKKGIAKQTAARLRKYYGSDIEVGQCGDGIKETGTVVAATAQTLIGFKPRKRKQKNGTYKTIPADPMLVDMVKNFEVLFLDEAHHASSDTWYSIALNSGALRRFGLSGTPLKNNDVADMKLIGATGPLICEVSSEVLIKLGFTAQPKIAVVLSENASGPDLPKEIEIKYHPRTGTPYKVERELAYKDAYRAAIIENKHHNRAVVRAAEWLYARGKKTLVICRRKDHFITLEKMLSEIIPTFWSAWGATETEVRDQSKGEFVDVAGGGVLLATTIFDEGEDIPAMNAIVLAEGVKVSTNALQRIGRGMRRKEGTNEVWVVDFAPTCHTRLLEHALARSNAYEGEGYPTRIVEDWPAYDDEGFDAENLLPFLNWET